MSITSLLFAALCLATAFAQIPPNTLVGVLTFNGHPPGHAAFENYTEYAQEQGWDVESVYINEYYVEQLVSGNGGSFVQALEEVIGANEVDLYFISGDSEDFIQFGDEVGNAWDSKYNVTLQQQ